MQYVFGSSIICEGMLSNSCHSNSKDAESAKNVTFHPDVKLKSVTLDGDVYDPSGSLSGGSRSNGSGVLVKMRHIKGLKADLARETDTLNVLCEKLASCRSGNEAYTEAKQNYDLKVHQVSLLSQQLDSNANSKVINQVEEIKGQIQVLESEIQELDIQHKESLKRQEELEVEIDQLTNNREGKLKSIQKEVDSLKKSLEKDAPKFKSSQQDVDLLREEISMSPFVYINC